MELEVTIAGPAIKTGDAIAALKARGFAADVTDGHGFLDEPRSIEFVRGYRPRSKPDERIPQDPEADAADLNDACAAAESVGWSLRLHGPRTRPPAKPKLIVAGGGR